MQNNTHDYKMPVTNSWNLGMPKTKCIHTNAIEPNVPRRRKMWPFNLETWQCWS